MDKLNNKQFTVTCVIVAALLLLVLVLKGLM